jgi:hypothetical protein
MTKLLSLKFLPYLTDLQFREIYIIFVRYKISFQPSSPWGTKPCYAILFMPSNIVVSLDTKNGLRNTTQINRGPER